MPLVRLELRNEYGLGDRSLHTDAATREDPKAVLEGVVVGGLVGILRQLGDLAGFAADIFHDLDELVAVTSARAHKIVSRIENIEASLPAMEKTFQCQTSHIHLAYLPGSSWHTDIQIKNGHLVNSELPQFVMDSYEECRYPPRLFLLDKFDTSGPGSCLKRYSDPSYFRRFWSNSQISETEKVARKRKALNRHKVEELRMRNREMQHVYSLSRLDSSLHASSPSFDGQSDTSVSNERLKNEVESHSTSFSSRNRSNWVEQCASASDYRESVDSKISVSYPKIQETYDSASSSNECIGGVYDLSLVPLQERNEPGSPSIGWDDKTEIHTPLSPRLPNINLVEKTSTQTGLLEGDEDAKPKNVTEVCTYYIKHEESKEEVIITFNNLLPLSSTKKHSTSELLIETDKHSDALNFLELEIGTDLHVESEREIIESSACLETRKDSISDSSNTGSHHCEHSEELAEDLTVENVACMQSLYTIDRASGLEVAVHHNPHGSPDRCDSELLIETDDHSDAWNFVELEMGTDLHVESEREVIEPSACLETRKGSISDSSSAVSHHCEHSEELAEDLTVENVACMQSLYTIDCASGVEVSVHHDPHGSPDRCESELLIETDDRSDALNFLELEMGTDLHVEPERQVIESSACLETRKCSISDSSNTGSHHCEHSEELPEDLTVDNVACIQSLYTIDRASGVEVSVHHNPHGSPDRCKYNIHEKPESSNLTSIYESPELHSTSKYADMVGTTITDAVNETSRYNEDNEEDNHVDLLDPISYKTETKYQFLTEKERVTSPSCDFLIRNTVNDVQKKGAYVSKSNSNGSPGETESSCIENLQELYEGLPADGVLNLQLLHCVDLAPGHDFTLQKSPYITHNACEQWTRENESINSSNCASSCDSPELHSTLNFANIIGTIKSDGVNEMPHYNEDGREDDRVDSLGPIRCEAETTFPFHTEEEVTISPTCDSLIESTNNDVQETKASISDSYSNHSRQETESYCVEHSQEFSQALPSDNVVHSRLIHDIGFASGHDSSLQKNPCVNHDTCEDRTYGNENVSSSNLATNCGSSKLNTTLEFENMFDNYDLKISLRTMRQGENGKTYNNDNTFADSEIMAEDHWQTRRDIVASTHSLFLENTTSDMQKMQSCVSHPSIDSSHHELQFLNCSQNSQEVSMINDIIHFPIDAIDEDTVNSSPRSHEKCHIMTHENVTSGELMSTSEFLKLPTTCEDNMLEISDATGPLDTPLQSEDNDGWHIMDFAPCEDFPSSSDSQQSHSTSEHTKYDKLDNGSHVCSNCDSPPPCEDFPFGSDSQQSHDATEHKTSIKLDRGTHTHARSDLNLLYLLETEDHVNAKVASKPAETSEATMPNEDIGNQHSISEAFNMKDELQDIANEYTQKPEASDKSSVCIWTNGGLFGVEPSKPQEINLQSCVQSDTSSTFKTKSDPLGTPLPHGISEAKSTDSSESQACILYHDGNNLTIGGAPNKTNFLSESRDVTPCGRNLDANGLPSFAGDLIASLAGSLQRNVLLENKRSLVTAVRPLLSSGVLGTHSLISQGKYLSNGLTRGEVASDVTHSSFSNEKSEDKYSTNANPSGLLRCSPSSPPSPPMQRMKISFQPSNGTTTPSLKLEFSGRNFNDGAEALMFPSFQLLHGPSESFQTINSESDDDIFYRSSEYCSENGISANSESDSEIWDPSEQAQCENYSIHDIYSGSGSDFAGLVETNQYYEHSDRSCTLKKALQNVESCFQPGLLDIPCLDSLRMSVSQE